MTGIEGANVVVTGGTGSIGSQLVREALARGAANVTAFSRDDSKQFFLRRSIGPDDRLHCLIGDVRDPAALDRAIRPDTDLVLHAAALKHVGVCERDPWEATLTNVAGTQNVVDACRRAGVDRLVSVSTDKAVDPACAMGLTKSLAECVTLVGGRHGLSTACVRFGNVMGSRGSVLPALTEAAQARGRMVITDPDVTRFAMTAGEAAALVLDAAQIMAGGEVFTLRMRAFRLGDLAEVLADMLGIDPPGDGIGLEPGEKLHESLVAAAERDRTVAKGDLLAILPAGTTASEGWVAADVPENSDRAPRWSHDELRGFIHRWLEDQ